MSDMIDLNDLSLLVSVDSYGLVISLLNIS
jgi:hypothetical protein